MWPAQHETIILVQELSYRLRARHCGQKGRSHDELVGERGQCCPVHGKVGERALEETQSHQKDREREKQQAPDVERRQSPWSFCAVYTDRGNCSWFRLGSPGQSSSESWRLS